MRYAEWFAVRRACFSASTNPGGAYSGGSIHSSSSFSSMVVWIWSVVISWSWSGGMWSGGGGRGGGGAVPFIMVMALVFT